uniref:Endonuclease/exonuclease/phosphatase domain-containing protein n=1 Tax=Salmo trutta TaxID=8032 RepID=A0A673X2R2_SALTR
MTSHLFLGFSALEDLVLNPVHTKPEDSVKELDELDVFLEVENKWKTDNFMILGDFNADRSYVSNKDMETSAVTHVHWLIKDDIPQQTQATRSLDRWLTDFIYEITSKAYGLSEDETLSHTWLLQPSILPTKPCTVTETKTLGLLLL